MFSHELLDFVPTPHPADALSTVHPHDAHLDPLFDSYIDSSYLDQSFCSDFSCCGQILPDLHRLLEHFEEQHVLPFPTDSRPLYSSPVYAQPRSAASAPYASYILSYPQTDPPLQPVSHPISSAHYRPRVLPDLDLSRIPPVPDLSLSPLSNSSAYSSPSLGEPICLPPSLFTVQPSRPPSPSRSSRRDRARARDTSDTDRDHQEARHTPTANGHPKPSSGAGPQRTAIHYSAARVDPTSHSRPVARTPERATLAASVAPPSPASKRRDGREKAYKCPHPGCTKSYLNPNGLKYHLEKGTCTNADVRPRQQLPPSDFDSAESQSVHVSVSVSASGAPETVSVTASDDVPNHADVEAQPQTIQNQN